VLTALSLWLVALNHSHPNTPTYASWLDTLAYRSEALERALAEAGIVLLTERSRQHGKRQQVEVALATLKREFRLGETLATTLVGLATRIAAKITAYTFCFYVIRILGRPLGRIKELWA
jgi:hypothetical protein